MAVLFEKTKLLTDKQFHYCPGCNHGIIHRLVAEVIDEMNLDGKVIGVAPVGCSVFAYDYFNCENADYIITAFGTVARIAKSAITELKAQGINVGLVRPITVWPFPYDAIRKVVDQPSVKAVLDVELNEGQMLEDVKLAINGTKEVDFFGHCGSQMPTTAEIVTKILSMKEGK